MSSCTDDKDSLSSFLPEMRTRLGLPAEVSDFGVYALADCTGPNSAFTTLVISDDNHTRFEQKSSSYHIIGFHDGNSSSMLDVLSGEVSPVDSATVTFLIGHELHMIAFYPESRFGEPVGIKDTTYYDQAATQLSFTDLLGGPIEVFYDQETHRPLGFNTKNHLGGGAEHIDVQFSQWQTKGEQPVFMEARFLQGDDVYKYKFTEVCLGKPSGELFQSGKVLISPD